MATVMSGPQSESDHRRPVGLAEWLVVAWIIGYAVFFFHFTLPNSNPPVSRVDVWLELPDVLWANVVAPPKSSGASWSHVSQRFDLFAVAAVIWLGSWAVGGQIDVDGDGQPDMHRAVFIIDRSNAEEAYDKASKTFDWKKLILAKQRVN